jgi:hypothetical protein
MPKETLSEALLLARIEAGLGSKCPVWWWCFNKIP